MLACMRATVRECAPEFDIYIYVPAHQMVADEITDVLRKRMHIKILCWTPSSARYLHFHKHGVTQAPLDMLMQARLQVSTSVTLHACMHACARVLKKVIG